MIGYLRGEVLEHSEGKLLLLASGVGYSVTVPQAASYIGLLPGQAAELFVHTHVREDVLDLFGFASRFEKEIFLLLLSVNGIGPKAAMSILSASEPTQLIQAILGGDTASLTRIPGIGKKTAERVVLELEDKARKKMETGAWPAAGRPSGKAPRSSVYEDARSALIGLGYREQVVTPLLKQAMSEGVPAGHRAEDLVKAALRQLI